MNDVGDTYRNMRSDLGLPPDPSGEQAIRSDAIKAIEANPVWIAHQRETQQATDKRRRQRNAVISFAFDLEVDDIMSANIPLIDVNPPTKSKPDNLPKPELVQALGEFKTQIMDTIRAHLFENPDADKCGGWDGKSSIGHFDYGPAVLDLIHQWIGSDADRRTLFPKGVGQEFVNDIIFRAFSRGPQQKRKQTPAKLALRHGVDPLRITSRDGKPTKDVAFTS